MENLRSKPFWDRSPLESLADGYKKLPRNFKLCMLATFIIGLAAHMYCYTNMLTGADDAFTVFRHAHLPARTVLLVHVGSLRLYFDLLIKTIRMPWLLGVMTLAAIRRCGMACVRSTLSITSSVGIILVSGLMVTSPTMISSNFYLTSAHMYAGALLFACHGCLCLRKSGGTAGSPRLCLCCYPKVVTLLTSA